MLPPVSIILSAVGGYVDTVGFLALQGLFTAHVTGNFVTLAQALMQGSSGVLAKLFALPVFCLSVFATQTASRMLAARRHPVLRRLLWAQVALLTLGASLAIPAKTFESSDSAYAIVTGMVFVAAMAIQNAAHRVHLAQSPPSTLMTGSTTQIMIDLADAAFGFSPASKALPRAWQLGRAVAAFAIGCAVGAIAFYVAGHWAFVPPAVIIFIAACAEEAGIVGERPHP